MSRDAAAEVNGNAASDNAPDASNKKKIRSNKTFQCSGFGNCRMQFSRSEHLARHIRKHTGERPFKCYCGRTFSRLDNLRQHAQTIHTNETIHSPYTTSTSKIQPSSPGVSKQATKSPYQQDIKSIEQNEHYTDSSQQNAITPLENAPITKNDSFEPLKLHTFLPHYFQPSPYISDHFSQSKTFSSPLLFHSSQDISLSKMDPTSSRFSMPDSLNLGIKNAFSSIKSSLSNECKKIQPFLQENHTTNINTDKFLNQSGTYYNESMLTTTTYNSTPSSYTSPSSNTHHSSESNGSNFNDSKLSSITILMNYDLERSNILSLSDKNEHSSISTLKHNDIEKMSIQFLCNQNITMGGIDILAEVAKIMN